MADDITVKTKAYTDKVRNAMYGKEVRSSIADSIDGIAKNVKEEIANDTLAISVNKSENDIKTINNTLGYEENKHFITDYDWTVGISSSNLDTSYTTDVRYFTTKEIIKADKDITIINPNRNYIFMAISKYSSDSGTSFISTDFTNPSSYTIKAGEYYKLNVKFVDNSDMTNEHMNNILNSIYCNSDLYTFTTKMLTRCDKSKFSINNKAIWRIGISSINSEPSYTTDKRYFTTENILKADTDIIIINPNKNLYFMALSKYSSTLASSFISTDFTNPPVYTIKAGEYYKLNVKFIDNSDMTVDAMEDFLGNMSSVASLYKYYNSNVGETWSFLGDSITEGVHTTKTYHEYIADKLGITAKNYGANGSCISTYTLSQDLHSYCMCKRIETVDKTSKKLFIFGGTNDFNRGCPLGSFYTVDSNGKRTFSADTNTFKGALSVMFQYAMQNFTDIVVLTPIHRSTFDTQPTDLQKNVAGLYLEDYVNAIKEACALFGIGKVIDLYTISGLNPNFSNNANKYFHDGTNDDIGVDLLHPNAKGHEKICDCIINNI